MLIVVSSPSGGGKSTVIGNILKNDPEMEYSVSVTSRSPRAGEINGESYTFVSTEEFQKWIKEDRFYEWARVHNHLYGTRKDVIGEKLARGKDVIMDLDFQGGLNVKRQSPDAVLVFLLPPSLEVLEKRLRTRQTDGEDEIQARLKNAREEIGYATRYDYVLINDDLEKTIEELKGIIRSERSRAQRLDILSGE
ncbi:guanylate kinase [Candidatus Sumerlaeota bacterium]|nr:guanylate kinase [Candidatus Sumerlaeota bacterium]